MTYSDLINRGRDLLASITSPLTSTLKFRQQLEDYAFNAEFKDDVPAWLTCVAALKGVDCGNFGVGSIIVDDRDNLAAVGYNQVFHPYFRSDGHAEMIAMETFEKENQDIVDMSRYRLYTSLESCPMCMTRLIVSGIRNIIHVAGDDDGGMVHLAENLPPVWLELIVSQSFEPARCSPELKKTAAEILSTTREERDALLFKRRGA
jgi:cytosine deaminase